MWTAEHTLDFLRARDSASFHDIHWGDQKLSLTLDAPVTEQSLTVMVPQNHYGLTLGRVEMDGVRQSFRRMTIKGRSYVLVETGSGGTFQITAHYR